MMYNPYQQSYYPQMRQEVIRVNGKNGADAYQLAPNSSILLLDETAPIIWLKVTDGASYPTVTGYEISPLQTQTADTSYADLESRIAKLEEVINGKSNTTDVKSTIKTIKQQSN